MVSKLALTRITDPVRPMRRGHDPIRCTRLVLTVTDQRPPHLYSTDAIALFYTVGAVWYRGASGVTYQRQPRQMPGGPQRWCTKFASDLLTLSVKHLRGSSSLQTFRPGLDTSSKKLLRYLCWKRALGGRPLFDSNWLKQCKLANWLNDSPTWRIEKWSWNETGTGNFGNIAKDLSAIATVTAVRQI